MKWLRRAALALGMPLVVLTCFAVLLFILRVIFIEIRGPSVDKPHLANKKTYLEQLQPLRGEPFNIVLVFFDDLGWGDLSSYGNAYIETPNIDRLAAEGLRMTDFYSASPVCTPSRAALMTGRFPPRTKTDQHVFFNDYHLVGFGRRMLGLANELPKEEITLAEILQESGYVTKLIGKWHLGSREGYRPTDFGFDNWFGVLYSNDMYPLDLFENDDVLIEDRREGSPFSAERDELRPLEGVGIDQRELTAMYTEQAIHFLEEQGTAPFFLYLSHSFPHVPLYASSAHAGTSRGGTYGDVVEDLDRSTGAILAALSRLGLEENTLVIVTSDNGADYTGSSGVLRGRKAEIFEGGQRVPMIARWPSRIPAGTVSNHMAMNTDILPTMLDLLDIGLPEDRLIDGRSIASILLSGKSSHDFLYYFPIDSSLPGAIRSKNYKLTWSMQDYGRSREHLSRISGIEAHDVQNLFPEVYKRLSDDLAAKRSSIEVNPRGWLDD